LVGLLVGGAVAAGIAAVALGFILTTSAFRGAAPVTTAPAAMAQTSPLYEQDYLEFNNPDFRASLASAGVSSN
jgi:hypothetical protein